MPRMASRRTHRFPAAVALGLLASCSGKSSAPPSGVVTMPVAVNTLEIVELKPGSGGAINAGQRAAVQYTGWLYETSAPDNKGKQFDSSLTTGKPFRFVVGGGE